MFASRWGFALALMRVVLMLGVGTAARADPAQDAYDRQDYTTAASLWRGAADLGDAHAAGMLGRMFDQGQGVHPNIEQAVLWYRRAAVQGDVASMFSLAVMLDMGVGGERSEMTHWYALAAEQGNARAAFNLAFLFETGDTVPRSPAKALHFYQMAAAGGLTAATQRLADPVLRRHAALEQADQALRASLAAPKAPTTTPTPTATPTPTPTTTEDARRMQTLLLDGQDVRSDDAALRALVGLLPVLRDSAQRGDALAEFDLGYCAEHGLGGHVIDPASAYADYVRAAGHGGDNARLVAAAREAASALFVKLTAAEYAIAQKLIAD